MLTPSFFIAQHKTRPNGNTAPPTSHEEGLKTALTSLGLSSYVLFFVSLPYLRPLMPL